MLRDLAITETELEKLRTKRDQHRGHGYHDAHRMSSCSRVLQLISRRLRAQMARLR
jgi:hypothetical protein